MKTKYGAFGTGAVPDPEDKRDLIYIAPPFGGINLPREYDATQEAGGIDVEDQNGSLSCVGQAWAYYTEILERLENKEYTDLSAKDVYSQIYLKNGGAYIRSGAKLIFDRGISSEALIPSYENGKPPTEEFMRDRSNVLEELASKDAEKYKAKEYKSLWGNGNMENIKQAIFLNKGVVSGFILDWEGWQGPFVKPPTNVNPTYGHCVYLVGWEVKNGVEYIKFINSWGKKWGADGYGYVPAEYFKGQYSFSLWTLQDKINENDMFELFKDINNPKEIYAVKKNIKRHVAGLSDLREGQGDIWADYGSNEDHIPEKDLSGYTEKKEIVLHATDSMA